MTTESENLLSQGIIGVATTIVESPDPTLLGVDGTIVFETKNMLFLRKDSITRQVSKSIAKKLEFKTSPCACFISGLALIGRPEDRISRLNNG
ncbi:MAG TPA: ribonuclease P protein subunit [Nitrososphaera sp.]|nr:ribonuclease P protein subunit [Nitrososphaera sp.]